MNGDELIKSLQAENRRLINLLERNGIDWRVSLLSDNADVGSKALRTEFSREEKLTLFGGLFRGRTDVFPERWESDYSGRVGYTPVCLNDRKPGICRKPAIKCGECSHRSFMPLSDRILYEHLAGKRTIGVYPLLEDDTCHFLAADFDEGDWREDAKAYCLSCEALQIPYALEISRSGQGAHVWIFFSGKVLARDARRLGAAIISHACDRSRQLKLSSYDRLFPNQDRLPKGGFGNLIALPLQKHPRERNFSEFVDLDFRPFEDQWQFLAGLERLPVDDLEPSIFRAMGSSHPLDVGFIEEEDFATPWKPKPSLKRKIKEVMPSFLEVKVANLLYFEKASLPHSLANRLIRLAAFQNPDFFTKQSLRLSVWNTPRIIGCAVNFPLHIGLPRGCLDDVRNLLKENGIRCNERDERTEGVPIDASFVGTLRPDQEMAVTAMSSHDTGVLSAPTAFGKTVTAAAIIAHRKVNTLILVHRTDLQKQWQERLKTFLDMEKEAMGVIGGGKKKPSGLVDIAVIQSLSREGVISDVVENYGQIIIDECHHLAADSFELILKKSQARYVLGVTATPRRKDGRHPIIFMQCGPIRHVVTQSSVTHQKMEVIPRYRERPIQMMGAEAIQDIFRRLTEDEERTAQIASEILEAYNKGRKVLVLTERTEHLQAIHAALGEIDGYLFQLHGRLSRKQRTMIISEMEALAPEEPRILVATGKLVGEGFDHPPLDTLVLTMPISWRGTLQQYAGRLHRQSMGKSGVSIIDFVDTGHPALLRMWEKRQKGYRAMGYSQVSSPSW